MASPPIPWGSALSSVNAGQTFAALQPAVARVVVALSTVRLPGNLGTIIRTCEAAGATLALLDSGPGPVRSTGRASHDGLGLRNSVVMTGGRLLRHWAHRHGGHVIGTSPDAAHDFRHIEYRPPVVLLMGGERRGLSPSEAAGCDSVVRIPMVGQADSLNLAIATGIVLYEAIRPGRR